MATQENELKNKRIWVDGCFDMMHFGHSNAIRQAKEFGSYLIVGVHSDLEIAKNKGPTVMKEQERYAAVAACKWVDEVVENAPYVTQVEWLNRYNCDYCVHGDDLVTAADGTDCYQAVKEANRFLVVKRTKGVSTTDLVARMLQLKKTHIFIKNENGESVLQPLPADQIDRASIIESNLKTFPVSSSRIVQFATAKEPKPGDKIVYIDGAFDMFHVGHVEILRAAKTRGDYLIVGLYSDEAINKYAGGNLPVMNIHERILSVLQCRFVDEVLIGAPINITQNLIDSWSIDLVVCGSIGHSYQSPSHQFDDQYKVAKDIGKFEMITSTNRITSVSMIQRILDNHEAFEARNKKKEDKELALTGKTFTK
eukprot:TRINITY_DN1180_c1_g1_i1.p1 TRINITY_DN1180_c1_g1~~TRINITY_DN1180_c1_g1_i1.p1  ORF type:complete len:367 (-),score=175.52 TRINITY_DN1180_c1_g1_i1:91-1191(-)